MVRPIGNKQKEIFYVSTIRHWVICIPISEYKFQSLMTLLSVLKYHSSSIPSLFLGSLETNGKWKTLWREQKIRSASIQFLTSSIMLNTLYAPRHRWISPPQRLRFFFLPSNTSVFCNVIFSDGGWSGIPFCRSCIGWLSTICRRCCCHFSTHSFEISQINLELDDVWKRVRICFYSQARRVDLSWIVSKAVVTNHV